VAVATAVAVALASFGLAAGIAYHRARTAGAVPASSSGPSFGYRGGFDPFGLRGSDPSGGGSVGNASPGSRTFGATSAPSGSVAATVASKVDPAVVDVNTEIDYGSATGAGTGMVVSSDGLVLTNNHVIDGATSITVTTVDNGRRYGATVVGTDPSEDIAVLRLTGASGLATIPVGEPSTISAGDPVVALGNAGGVGGAPVVATGVVQDLGQTITASDDDGANAETLSGLIVVDAPIQPGDSGGPLATSSGQVIGIDTAASVGRGWRMRIGTGLGFAIPIDHALAVAREIESGQATGSVHIGTTGFLGVALDPSAARAVVEGVEPASPAAHAGLAAGDTITALDGQPVDSADTLSALTKRHRAGDTATVSWSDSSGGHHSAAVVLAAGAPD
jgi:S1-C subfamily serine protease